MLDLCHSPASPLANLLLGEDKLPELTFLSGPSGVGKSTWCLQLAEQARASSLVVGGLISPPVFIDGHKAGIDLVDQLTGARRHLAVRRDGVRVGINTASWVLDPETLAWGNRHLRDLPPCDCVILDELGPLEFTRGEGLQAGLKLIDSRQFPLVIAVIRPRFIPLARRRWPWGEVLTVVSDREIAGAITGER